MMFSGRHPPVSAQELESARDQVQDEQIREANAHIAFSDRYTNERLDKLEILVDANTRSANSIETEGRVFVGIIGFLTASGLALQFRRKVV
jgi:hypothetical protein